MSDSEVKHESKPRGIVERSPSCLRVGWCEPQARQETRLARLATLGFNTLLLIAVATLGAFLLTSGGAQRIPYDEESLGEYASTVVKADRDFDLVNAEKTDRERNIARDAVLPVYDFDPGIVEEGLARIRGAFGTMQAISADLEAAHGKGLEEAFAQARPEFQRRLETPLDDMTFATLSANRFSPEVEREIARLFREANEPMVTDNRDALVVEGGGGRGIVLRRLTGDLPGPDTLQTDLSGIRDQTELRTAFETVPVAPEYTGPLAQAIRSLVIKRIRANLRLNSAETSDRRQSAYDSVHPVITQLKRGEKIIGDGERIERRHLAIFKALREQAAKDHWGLSRVGAGLVAGAVILVLVWFGRTAFRKWKPTRKDLVFGAVALCSFLAIDRLLATVAEALHDRFLAVPAEILYYFLPFAAGAMLVRLLLTIEAATVFAAIFAILSGIMLGTSIEMAIFCGIGSLLAIAWVARANDRAALFRAGLATGIANVALIVFMALFTGKQVGWELARNLGIACSIGFAGGALGVPILVMGLTPLAESIFRYTTDIRLLELANLNHPALKELIVQAPGTYHHSIVLGSLVEAAAESIGANSMLARVAAYYHDIGKGKNPLYFGENQRGANKHDKLTPQMSALILKRHVIDGMELARQYNLPAPVAAIIPQHHGTRLIGYFFHKALNGEDASEIDESLFRYAGPKPQTREAALVMLGDAVEAGSRALSDPTLENLHALVQKMINDIFVDGQLDECDLTLRDLHLIARSFTRTLGGIHHSRPVYPTPAPMQAELPGLRSR